MNKEQLIDAAKNMWALHSKEYDTCMITGGAANECTVKFKSSDLWRFMADFVSGLNKKPDDKISK